MYPQQQLIRLDAYKTALRHDIALHRDQCARAADRALQPLRLLDRALALWRKFSPLALAAALPLGLLLRRDGASRHGILSVLLRWGPLLFSAAGGRQSALARCGHSPFGKTEV